MALLSQRRCSCSTTTEEDANLNLLISSLKGQRPAKKKRGALDEEKLGKVVGCRVDAQCRIDCPRLGRVMSNVSSSTYPLTLLITVIVWVPIGAEGNCYAPRHLQQRTEYLVQTSKCGKEHPPTSTECCWQPSGVTEMHV